MQESIIKDVRNLFKLKGESRKKKIDYTANKDIRNLFRLKKKMKQSNMK